MAQRSQEDSIARVSNGQPADAREARRRKPLLRRVQQYYAPYLFISPFFILFLIFGVFPPLFGLYLSFHSWDGIGTMANVGLQNYSRVFADRLFWRSIANTVLFILLATVPGVLLSITTAALLDMYTRRRVRSLLLATYFSPMVTSSVAAVVIFGSLYGTNFGLINAGLRWLGLPSARWLQDPSWMPISLALLLIWKYFGWNVVLFLAALQSIPADYSEAGRVDGANDAQIFWYITVPLLNRTVIFVSVVSIIGMFQLFAEPLLLATSPMGGRSNALLTPMMYLYNNAFSLFQFGYASAIAYVLFFIILVLSLANMRLLKRD